MAAVSPSLWWLEIETLRYLPTALAVPMLVYCIWRLVRHGTTQSRRDRVVLTLFAVSLTVSIVSTLIQRR